MGKQAPQDRAGVRRGPQSNLKASEGFKQAGHRLRAADLGFSVLCWEDPIRGHCHQGDSGREHGEGPERQETGREQRAGAAGCLATGEGQQEARTGRGHQKC